MDELENIQTPFHAERPLQHICFYPVEIPAKEGDVYVFTWVDVYSQFLFQTGIEKTVTDLNILKHLNLFLKEPKFISNYKNLPLTIFLHKFQHLVPTIHKTLEPYQGNVIVHDQYVAKIVVPVMKEMFEFLSRPKK